ncbi:MAG: hypothetical protein RIS44_1769 [Pseudomonadota bacterium]|jgi:hypothetical protein
MLSRVLIFRDNPISVRTEPVEVPSPRCAQASTGSARTGFFGDLAAMETLYV